MTKQSKPAAEQKGLPFMLYAPNGSFLARFFAPTPAEGFAKGREILTSMGRSRGSVKQVAR